MKRSSRQLFSLTPGFSRVLFASTQKTVLTVFSPARKLLKRFSHRHFFLGAVAQRRKKTTHRFTGGSTRKKTIQAPQGRQKNCPAYGQILSSAPARLFSASAFIPRLKGVLPKSNVVGRVTPCAPSFPTLRANFLNFGELTDACQDEIISLRPQKVFEQHALKSCAIFGRPAGLQNV
jgi:hypothetical protein